MTKNEKEYCQWIRLGPCVLCLGGDWDEQRGEWHNTVSHVKSKGSGGGIFNNIVPMCIKCHRSYEDSTKKNRKLLLEVAKQRTELWKSRNWWRNVRVLQGEDV